MPSPITVRLGRRARQRPWRRAIAESERMAEAFARWVKNPI